MRVRLETGKRAIKVKARRYSADQKEFLEKYVQQLVDMGFFIEMSTANWQAAPNLVEKKGRAKYRMTIDLRPVDSATAKESWPMPPLESEIHEFAGSKYFASLDFVSGYWQLPLHPDS